MQAVITGSDESLICSMANKILPILCGTDLKLHQRQHIQYKSVRRATLPALCFPVKLVHALCWISLKLGILACFCTASNFWQILTHRTGSYGFQWGDSKNVKGTHYELWDWRMTTTHSDRRTWNGRVSEHWRDLNLLLSFLWHGFVLQSNPLLPHPRVWVLPCLFQRCPLIESEVTALREILEDVGVISTWILRAPSLLLLFSAALCSEDLMALPTWGQAESTHPHILLLRRMPPGPRINQWLSTK